VDFESLREESDSFRGVTKNLFVDEKTARLMYYRIGCVLRAVLALETTQFPYMPDQQETSFGN
jgi:hypothetical protein